MTRIDAKWFLLVLLLALALGTGASAEESQDPITGEWAIITRYRGDRSDASVVIKRGPEGLTGTWTSPRGKLELEELAFAAGTLTFVRVVDQGPRKLNIAFTAKVEGNRLEGEHRLPRQKVPCWGARGDDALKTLEVELKKLFARDPEKDFEKHSRRAAPVDRFPVLTDPELTPAAEAKMLRDEEPVIGVAIGDEAKAYPISIMGVHELANDTCGGKPIMTSW
ncbi:MAG: DUF3179 domain-containing protein [bacterium]|nr:DUF3179 domain-containing protein [bacterium]